MEVLCWEEVGEVGVLVVLPSDETGGAGEVGAGLRGLTARLVPLGCTVTPAHSQRNDKRRTLLEPRRCKAGCRARTGHKVRTGGGYNKQHGSIELRARVTGRRGCTEKVKRCTALFCSQECEGVMLWGWTELTTGEAVS